MNDQDFIEAMSRGLPALPAPSGLEVNEYQGLGSILKGNEDLELPEAERVGTDGAR